MQQSGGLLLPPVQKLVASLIFAPSGAKMQFESYIVFFSYPLFKTVNFAYGLPYMDFSAATNAQLSG